MNETVQSWERNYKGSHSFYGNKFVDIFFLNTADFLSPHPRISLRKTKLQYIRLSWQSKRRLISS
jgi:hypothetical protein